MPVRKFRSIGEMDSVTSRPPLDPENLRIAMSLTETAYRIRPWHFPPGVHKHRSIEEANRARDEWSREATHQTHTT
jgi:hypothetical protein